MAKKPSPRKLMPYAEMSAAHERMEASGKSPRKKSSKSSKGGKSKIGY